MQIGTSSSLFIIGRFPIKWNGLFTINPIRYSYKGFILLRNCKALPVSKLLVEVVEICRWPLEVILILVVSVDMMH